MSAWSIGYNLSLAGSMMTTFMRGGLGTTAGEVAERIVPAGQGLHGSRGELGHGLPLAVTSRAAPR